MAKFLLIASAAVAVSASKFGSAPTRCDPTLLVPIEDVLAPEAFAVEAPCDNTPTRHCSAPHRIDPTPCTRAITIADEECCDEEHSPVEHCEDSCSCGGKKTLNTSCCGCSCSSNDDGCCTTSCTAKNCCENDSDNCDSCTEEEIIVPAICDGKKDCPTPSVCHPTEFPCHGVDDDEFRDMNCPCSHVRVSCEQKQLCKDIRRRCHEMKKCKKTCAPVCRSENRQCTIYAAACQGAKRCNEVNELSADERQIYKVGLKESGFELPKKGKAAPARHLRGNGNLSEFATQNPFEGLPVEECDSD